MAGRFECRWSRAAFEQINEAVTGWSPPRLKIEMLRDWNDPYGTRTRVAGVKGRSPRPLDEGAL